MRRIGKYHKRIAPRLASGKSRENWGGRLPEDIKYGLYQIARKEGKSVSWVMEEVVIAFFGLKTPDYLKPKPKPAEVAKEKQTAQDLAESTARDKHNADDRELVTRTH